MATRYDDRRLGVAVMLAVVVVVGAGFWAGLILAARNAGWL